MFVIKLYYIILSVSLKLTDHIHIIVLLLDIENDHYPLWIHFQGNWSYEGCSNMNASGFITFFTYMLRQNGNRFYKGLYVTFKVTPDLKKNTVYLSSYSPLSEGHKLNALNIYSDRDERIVLRRTGEIS